MKFTYDYLKREAEFTKEELDNFYSVCEKISDTGHGLYIDDPELERHRQSVLEKRKEFAHVYTAENNNDPWYLKIWIYFHKFFQNVLS